MQKSTKLKIGILSIVLLTSVGTATYELHKWSKSYSKMEQKEIKSFETVWSKIWDNKTKTFKPTLTQATIQDLTKYTATPSQKEKLKAAKVTAPLLSVANKKSSLPQLLAAANNYYIYKDDDDNYPEQQKANEQTLKNIETLIQNINTDIDLLTLTNNNIDFDKSTTTSFQLTPISTPLAWDGLEVFNSHVNAINNLIKTQVTENNERQNQETIIQLKQQLDEFNNLAKQYESNIKSNYITIKDLKSILSILSNVQVVQHKNWFNGLNTAETNVNDANTVETTYVSSLSDQFFIDNKELQPYQNHLSQIKITVVLTKKMTPVSNKSDESTKETFQLTVNTSVSQNDDDLVNTNSLSNISIVVTQNQTIKYHKRQTETSDSSSTLSSSDNQSSTSSSSSTIPIRRED